MGSGASDKVRISIRVTAATVYALDRFTEIAGNNRSEKCEAIIQNYFLNKLSDSSIPLIGKRPTPNAPKGRKRGRGST